MTHPKDIFLKLKDVFKEDPDQIRAKREVAKKADDVMRQMFMKRLHDNKRQLETLAKAREARALKPKTKEGTK